jgi:hypothetical protein
MNIVLSLNVQQDELLFSPLLANRVVFKGKVYRSLQLTHFFMKFHGIFFEMKRL